jgi:hypothetical protein
LTPGTRELTVYSAQPLWVFEQLLKTGHYQARPQLGHTSLIGDASDKSSRMAYDWLCEQMQSRGLARPCAPGMPDSYPIWAFYQWAGPERCKPDLRNQAYKGQTTDERQVLLTLRIPREYLLLSDFDAWHVPLNYAYLGGQPDMDKFKHVVESKGLRARHDIPFIDAELHQTIVASWQAIFDLEVVPEILGFSASEQCIQATFWELDVRHVRKAVEFGGGRPLVKRALA